MRQARLTTICAAATVLFSHAAQAQSWVSVPSDNPQTLIATALWGDQTRIVARCDAGKLTAFVSRAASLPGAVVFVLTQRRPDDPSGTWWRMSQDGLSIVARQPVGFVRDLHKGGILDIVVKSRDAEDWETTLELPSEPGPLTAVMEACAVNIAEPPKAPSVSWRSPPRPTEQDFPGAALSPGLSGVAAVSCVVTPDGVPTDCIVIDEAPLGYGFGYNAAKIVERGRLNVDAAALALSEPIYFQVTVPFRLERTAVPDLPLVTRVREETLGILPDPEVQDSR